MKNFILSVLSSILVLIGVVSMVTPIPGGTFLIAGGLTALICTSPRARLCLRHARGRFGFFDKTFLWLEKMVGERVPVVGNALRKTRPGNDEDAVKNC